MKYLPLFLLLNFLFISCADKNNEIKISDAVEDDIGNIFIVDTIPSTIITLAPNLTEMIYFLGLEEKLIGNTLFCNFPPEANEVEKIGDLLNINYEKILALKPDIILMTVEGNTIDAYDKLKSLGLSVFVSNPKNYYGIKKTVSDLGSIFRIEEKVDRIISEWTETILLIKQESKIREGKTGMFLVSVAPIMLAGANTFLDELITSTGLINIASDAIVKYPVFSREEIVNRNPDYIIIAADNLNIEEKLISHYSEWKTLKAIKEDNIIAVDPDLFLRPGPRFITAVSTLHKLLKENERIEYYLDK